ncbi:MAG: hypothetical protein ACE5R6_03070 [Candidatus Heimdallarchaeota archaeon]
MADTIYIVQRYGVPIYFGTLPASKLNFTIDQPLIAAGLFSLHRFGLRNATTKILRTILLYKQGDGVALTFHDFKEAETIRVDYDALELQTRAARSMMGKETDSTIKYELDLQGIAVDLENIDISKTSLRTLAFLRGMLSAMSTEFERDIIDNICRRGLAYTQYSQEFERRLKQAIQKVADESKTKLEDANELALLRDYEELLEMQVTWDPKPKTANFTISFDKKSDLGVQPDSLAPLIVASKQMLGEIFEPIYGTKIEFLIIDLENENRVFVAYKKGSNEKDLYSVRVYRITEHMSSYTQEIALLEEVRAKLPPK